MSDDVSVLLAMTYHSSVETSTAIEVNLLCVASYAAVARYAAEEIKKKSVGARLVKRMFGARKSSDKAARAGISSHFYTYLRSTISIAGRAKHVTLVTTNLRVTNFA